jgi:hypothetical protein
VSARIVDARCVINNATVLRPSGVSQIEGILQAHFPSLAFLLWDNFFYCFVSSNVILYFKNDVGIDLFFVLGLVSVLLFKKKAWALYQRRRAIVSEEEEWIHTVRSSASALEGSAKA